MLDQRVMITEDLVRAIVRAEISTARADLLFGLFKAVAIVPTLIAFALIVRQL